MAVRRLYLQSRHSVVALVVKGASVAETVLAVVVRDTTAQMRLHVLVTEPLAKVTMEHQAQQVHMVAVAVAVELAALA
jgi:hypothetical protein